MNWADQEALKIMSQRGKPGPRLVRGLLWALLTVSLMTIILFLAFTVLPDAID